MIIQDTQYWVSRTLKFFIIKYYNCGKQDVTPELPITYSPFTIFNNYCFNLFMAG